LRKDFSSQRILCVLRASALYFLRRDLPRGRFKTFSGRFFEVAMSSQRIFSIATFLVSSIAFATTIAAQSTPRESLLILSKADHTLAIVDPATLKVLGKLPVGNDPHEVIASTDGTTAYVSNYGGGAYNTLAVLDLADQKALPQIDLGGLRGPHGLDFASGKVWFTAEAAKAIGSYDPAAQKIDWILGTGQNRTHMIYVAPDLKRVITSNVSSGTISVIERVTLPAPNGPPPGAPNAAAGAPRATPSGPAPGPAREDWNQTVISVGLGSEGFDVLPSGNELWVASSQDGNISVVDIAQKKVLQTLAANVRGANRLKFTPDGKYAFVSMLGSADVVVFDVAARREFKRIPVGHGAAGIQMQPDGSRAFVACTPDNYVVAIDLKTFAITAHIDVGPNPDGMAWASRQ
jgi:YVTN family beta-propeller protein